MYDKLVQRRAPSTAMDPLAVLPVEITEMIFRYLNFRKIV